MQMRDEEGRLYRDCNGYENRVPPEWKERSLTLDELDSLVYQFNRGCSEGQNDFINFVTMNLMSKAEAEAWQKEQDVRRYLESWVNYDRASKNSLYRLCEQRFEPIYGFEEFCAHCYRRKDAHDARDRRRREHMSSDRLYFNTGG